jgi:hypothetical protein
MSKSRSKSFGRSIRCVLSYDQAADEAKYENDIRHEAKWRFYDMTKSNMSFRCTLIKAINDDNNKQMPAQQQQQQQPPTKTTLSCYYDDSHDSQIWIVKLY